MKEFQEKLNYEETDMGNQLKRWWSPAGCDGSEYDVMNSYFNKGFDTLFCTAPYFWQVANFETFRFITYTEGDMTEIICKNKKKFLEELDSIINWWKGQDEEVYKEIKENLKNLKEKKIYKR